MLRMGEDGECILEPYEKDEKMEEDIYCRWVLVRENQKGTVSIRLAAADCPIRWDVGGGLNVY